MENEFLERAKQLRSDPAVHYNCAQTVILAFADECGLSDEQAFALGSNFGSGMQMGSVCGAVSGGAMVLGMMGATQKQYQDFLRAMRENHDGITDCRELLAKASEEGVNRKEHCDGLIYEAVENIVSVMKL